MTASMSDEWVVSLIDEKSPEELTATEIALLRERAKVSPAVRRALAEKIRLEEALYAALSPPTISGEEILRDLRRARRRKMAAVLAAVLLLACAGGFWWLANTPVDQRRPAERPRLVIEPVVAPRPDKVNVPRITQRGAVEAPRPIASDKATNVAGVALPSAEVDGDISPWPALADDAPVVPFDTAAVNVFGESVPGYEIEDEFLPATLKSWIAAVPGSPFNVNEGQWRGKRFAGLDGVARLLPTWREDAVLRIAPFDTAEFAIHFWNGDAGRTIRFYPHQRPQLLAAYATTREAGKPTPKTYQLVTTDGGTGSRANAGVIEFRHQEGRLVVTRGATPLLVVPMPHLPTDIFIEAKTRLRTLAMYRGAPAAIPEPLVHRVLLPEPLPAPSSWLLSKEAAPRIERDAEHLMLSPAQPPPGQRQWSWAAIALPDAKPNGLVEAIFHIASLTPGTGVYLGDEKGTPIHALFAAENGPAGAPALSYGWTTRDGRMPERRWRWDADPRQELVPAAGPGTWVRVIVGPGGLKVAFSGDGTHWGPAARNPERAVRGNFASVGLFAVADGKPRSIAVSRIGIRELTGLTSAVEPQLRARVPDFSTPPPERPADWLLWAASARPDDVLSDDWMRATAVETLSRGAGDSVSRSIISGLINDAVRAERPLDQSLAVLHDLALLSDLWNDASRDLATAYDDLARRVTRDGGADAAAKLLSIEEAYLTSPIWTESRVWAVPPGLARDLAAVAAWSQDDKTSASAQQVAAYLAPSHPDGGWSGEEDPGLARLLTWAAARAKTSTGRVEGESRYGWQHPLGTEPGREGTAVAAELRSALDAGAYADAARLLTALADLADLVPAISDSDRFLPTAALALEAAERHPQLVTAIREQFGDAAILRVRQAIAAGDEQGVRLAAIRYLGTPAALEARNWLGERAMAAGSFTEAESHFAAASMIAPPEQRDPLAARVRLAAALSGTLDGASPVAGEVAFGSETLSAGKFNDLVGELQKARARSVPGSNAAIELPKAVPIKPEPRGRFAGDLGRSPDRGEYRRFDWVGRQIGVTIDRGVIYLTNRFQVVAFDPKRNAPWWTVGLGGEQGDAHALPNVAFTPVARDDHLYVRRLTNHGPELACLAVKDGGKLAWRTDQRLIAVSDPIVESGVVTLLTTATSNRTGGPVSLMLTRLRADDGSLIASSPVIVMNQAESERASARLIEANGGFLIVAQGTIGLCDHNGSIGWLRRLPYLPASVDLDFDRVTAAAPILADDRVYLAAPGTRSVICMDVATGRLIWHRPSGEAFGLAGVAGGVVIVQGPDVLRGIDRETGKALWSFQRDGLLEGTLCSDAEVLATARTPLDERLDGLSLLRLDPKTGKAATEQLVRVQRKDEIRCGPLFVNENVVWGFVGEGWRNAERTLVAFTADPSALPVVTAEPVPAEPAPAGPEWRSVEQHTTLLAAIVLPGWRATGAQVGSGAKFGAPLLDEHRGEKNVLMTQASRERAARFTRHYDVPQKDANLVARVGREDDAGWTFRLFADGALFASEPVNKETAPDGWRTVTIDLAPLAGRSVLLTVDQGGPSNDLNRATKAYWKSVTVP